MSMRLRSSFSRACFATSCVSAAKPTVNGARGSSATLASVSGERSATEQLARQQIAFYGSTRNYAYQFDDLGFEGTSARLNEKLKAGDMAGMAALITDEMLEHFAVIGPWDGIADALVARYGGLAERIIVYTGAEIIRRDPTSVGRWAEIARTVAGRS